MCSTCAATLARSRLRASPRSSQRSGTTLGALPPLMIPTLAVVSSSTRPRRMAATARAAASTALRPACGSMPAWAATPVNTASTALCVGAAVISVPGAPSLSRTNTARARRSDRSSALAPCSPISSPTVNTSSTSAAGGS